MSRYGRFPLSQIAEIQDVDKLTTRLISQLDAFKAFLSAGSMTAHDVTSVLDVLYRVVENDLMRENVLRILQVVCTSQFLDVHLTSLIHRELPARLKQGQQRSVVANVIIDIHRLLACICLKLPEFAAKCFRLLTALRTNTSLVRALPADLVQSLQDLLTQSQRCMAAGSEQQRQLKVRSRPDPNDDEEIPPENFTELPIFPNKKDMNCDERIFLRVNKEVGAYRDVNHYLDVQFRLLREDYIRPLRSGIREFKQLKGKRESMAKSQDLWLYHNVRIVDMICKESLEHCIQFQLSPQLARVRWQSSKRLMFGSLVCLSKDCFETLYFAVVSDRTIRDLQKGMLRVRFEKTDLEKILNLSCYDTFTMAESSAFFEAYRHVLEGLQEMKDCLPMSRYIVHCVQDIQPPSYLTRNERMDLSSLLKDNSRLNASYVKVICSRTWPPVTETVLNTSQLKAIQLALSNELAIIQGPPGTGKTYVGLKMTQVLLENQQTWRNPIVGERPILVVCYTNHALDQFLEGILKFCPKGIIRVGSRCKNPSLEQFNLKNIRQKNRKKSSRSVKTSIGACRARLAILQEKVMDSSTKLTATTKGVVGVQTLVQVMPRRHYLSLLYRPGNQRTTQSTCCMIDWLTNGGLTQTGEGAEDGDSYPVLVKKVTAKILQGKSTCDERTVDPDDVHSLSPGKRAKLYRFWLHKLWNAPSSQLSKELQMWQTKARHEILPDKILLQLSRIPLHLAIKIPLIEKSRQQSEFCVRAWLGVSEELSPEIASQISLENLDICNGDLIKAEEVIRLPFKVRFQLYRSWLQKIKLRLRLHIREAEKLAAVNVHVQKHILDDELLERYMQPALFKAIRSEMLQRHQRQSQYFIREWLGIQEFCQNSAQLEKLLESLDESDGDEEEGLNVQEEAVVMQRERQLDDDDDDDDQPELVLQQSRQQQLSRAMQDLGIQKIFGPDIAEERDTEGWTVPARSRRQKSKELKRLLSTSKSMTQREAEAVRDLWSPALSLESRVRLYLFWLESYQSQLRADVKDQVERYDLESRMLQELRQGEDKDLLTQAKVIGMTTTGAARYRRVLKSVACPIIILEEAAEVLEAHVVTSLQKTCQHLILIGDHQQLRPSPAVYDLGREYQLDLSLFERLVNNRLPHATLDVQHRMRPEIANIVRHIYPSLTDHESTRRRSHIRGMKENIFLFHHEEHESGSTETSSKSNRHEAELCVRLCHYLLQQGYPPESITILTAYSGQVYTLKNIIKEETLVQSVLVTSVDNFQGEESEIIILSLVRNNQQDSVGFLKTDNRVCVALSRARDGFYAFGNFRMLLRSSDLWLQVCRTASSQGQLGEALTLQCENHPTVQTPIKTAKDFDQVSEGGCKQPCNFKLNCRHVCKLKCHAYDRKHLQYKCREKCERVFCSKGHPCVKRCFQDCGKVCLYSVKQTVPRCGHEASMDCSRDPASWVCQDQCKQTLPCGHQCSGTCAECYSNKKHIKTCTKEMLKRLPCGHCAKGPCNVLAGEVICTKACHVILKCGHVCLGTCNQCLAGTVHVRCKAECGRRLPGCGHQCRLPCWIKCLPCKEKACREAVVKASSDLMWFQ